MPKRIKILEMVEADMKTDAKDFDGQPFNGHTVATYFGVHGAAIAALAKIMQSIVEEINSTKSIIEDPDAYECPIHGKQDGPDCSKC